MRAAVYARVSSQAQRDRHTIESQLRVLPDFIRGRGWELVETYVDDGRSAKAGQLAARTGLAAMLRDAGAGRFEVLAVVDVDRLTRSEDLTERGAILGGLQRAGVKVAIATTGQVLDFSSSMGDLFGTLQAFFAAEENRKRRERTVAGKLTAIAQGKKPAGPTPYGYRYDRATGAWSVHELEAAVVREIYARTHAGEVAWTIAADLAERGVARPQGGAWIRERVYAVLRQSAYRGEWVADKNRGLAIATPAIVASELWYAVNDRARSSARKLRGLRRHRYVYLLGNAIARCGLCGAPIGIATAAASRPDATPSRYVCEHRRRPLLERCMLPYWRTAEADERVWTRITRFLQSPRLVDAWARGGRAIAGGELELWRKDLASTERRLDALARAEAAILARFRRGLVSPEAMDLELAAAARDRDLAKRQADAARRAASSAYRLHERVATAERLVASLRARTENAAPEARRALVALLVRPGAAIIQPERIVLGVRLAQATTAACSEDRAGWIEGDGADPTDLVTFRLVA